MFIARLLYPVKVLGPGNRVGIWFCGCKHHCKGCSNPELWEFQAKYKTTAKIIETLIKKIECEYPIDGFTLTGGDPLEQPEALRELLPILQGFSKDILLYTGYEYDEVAERLGNILGMCSVVIDGKYIQELNHGAVLKGSDNQNIIILHDEFVGKYRDYIEQHTNEIQNFTLVDGVVSVGIHRPGYETELNGILLGKGLKKDG